MYSKKGNMIMEMITHIMDEMLVVADAYRKTKNLRGIMKLKID